MACLCSAFCGILNLTHSLQLYSTSTRFISLLRFFHLTTYILCKKLPLPLIVRGHSCLGACGLILSPPLPVVCYQEMRFSIHLKLYVEWIILYNNNIKEIWHNSEEKTDVGCCRLASFPWKRPHITFSRSSNRIQVTMQSAECRNTLHYEYSW
jgi:hypothetical protein